MLPRHSTPLSPHPVQGAHVVPLSKGHTLLSVYVGMSNLRVLLEWVELRKRVWIAIASMLGGPLSYSLPDLVLREYTGAFWGSLRAFHLEKRRNAAGLVGAGDRARWGQDGTPPLCTIWPYHHFQATKSCCGDSDLTTAHGAPCPSRPAPAQDLSAPEDTHRLPLSHQSMHHRSPIC